MGGRVAPPTGGSGGRIPPAFAQQKGPKALLQSNIGRRPNICVANSLAEAKDAQHPLLKQRYLRSKCPPKAGKCEANKRSGLGEAQLFAEANRGGAPYIPQQIAARSAVIVRGNEGAKPSIPAGNTSAKRYNCCEIFINCTK